MIKVVAMRMGFAESGHLSWLIYEANKTFKTRHDAFASLALMLYEKFWSSTVTQRKMFRYEKCCQKVMDNKDVIFCPTCGTKIADPPFIPEKMESFVKELSISNNDESGYEEFTGEIDNPDGWLNNAYQFNYTRKQMLIIQEQAEIQVVKMLSRIKPELFSEFPDYGKPDENDYEGTETTLDVILRGGI